MIASPSDVEKECKAVERAIHGWNRRHGEREGVVFVPWRWSIDATPSLAAQGQSVIDAQGVDESDVVVAIFWSRLGSPVLDAVSGTAHEIERARAQGKPVHVYFSHRPIDPTGIDRDQLQRVEELKEELHRIGLTTEFGTITDLEEQIQRDLTFDADTLSAHARPDYFSPPGIDRVYEEVSMRWSYMPSAEGNPFWDGSVAHKRRMVVRSRTGLSKFVISMDRDGDAAPAFRPENPPRFELTRFERDDAGVATLRRPHKSSGPTFAQFVEFLPPLREGESAEIEYRGSVPDYKFATSMQIVSASSNTKLGLRDWDFNEFVVNYPIALFSYSVFIPDVLGAEPLGVQVDRSGRIDSELTAAARESFALEREEHEGLPGSRMSIEIREPALKHSYRLMWRPHGG